MSRVADTSLFSISWPIFIDVFLHFLTLLINTYMVSHVSSSLVAAMVAGNHIFDLCITLFSFISVGCSVVIAQYLGARNTTIANKAIHISIGFNMLLGISLAILLFFGGNILLKSMNTPEHLLEDGFNYLHILGICLIPEATSLILAAVLRVYGKVKTAMYVTLIVNMLTIIINTIVLYGLFGLPKYGLVGVAWSTVFGRVIGVILLSYLLMRGLKIKLKIPQLFKWERSILSKILHIGLPAAGENLAWIGHFIVLISFIGLMGETALATQAIYFQISLLMMLFGISISIGNEILVGHLVGAKRFEDAYNRGISSLKFAIIVTVVVVFIFYFLSNILMNSFTDNVDIIKMALPLFTLALILEPIRSINIVMVNALRASGDARFPLITAIIFMWGVCVPIAWFLGIKCEMGLLGVWIGFVCDESLRGAANAYRWKSKKWQAKRLNVDI
ncbi:MATE family efflux transporter [Gammaproteobacteria bacterium]|nr:MATE family efflux transporter [Gammaproteobacteria bacterium]